ncbi:MAG: GNAT family N-acetyltransferase [Gemmatimonadota bacterium]|nr:GNAT family N-acetyltransferase [Gemmatimonadota bacterium]
MHVRLLTRNDAAEFQALRLRALLDNPEAFGSTYAQEEHIPLETIATRLGDSDDGSTNFVLGAADKPNGPLHGLAGCYRESAVKQRHKAVIWGMFVAAEARGRGAGRLLLDAVIRRAAYWPGLEQLTLSVVPENVAARTLYVQRGFVPYAVEPRALAQGGRYYDLEYLWLRL